jgi:hypothetical protein
MPYTGTVLVYDPTARPLASARSCAPRPGTLAGLRPGILENRKANARVLLESMVEQLRMRAPLGPLTLHSKNAAGPAAGSTIQSLAKQCDFVLVGSCD